MLDGWESDGQEMQNCWESCGIMNFKQLKMVHRKLWRLSIYFNLAWMRLKKDNDMSMRKAPFLKLNGVKEACNFFKDTIVLCAWLSEGSACPVHLIGFHFSAADVS